MLTNIFKLAEYEGRIEDRFTAAWGYVLHRESRLAQAVADILLESTPASTINGLAGTSPNLAGRVVGVVDHPPCNSIKKPDFRIDFEGFNILVEHKLDAFLHENQLQDYLAIEENKETYLAFIAPSTQHVPLDVLAHPRYLKPKGRTHFRWSDFYPAVKDHPGWLAREFAEFMAHLGMAPFTLKGPEDLFDTTAPKAVEFDKALGAAVREVFMRDNPGCITKGTPSGLGREVRKPRSNISLIYAWATQRSPCEVGFVGPALAVQIYEKDCSVPCLPAAVLVGTEFGITIERHPVPPSQTGEGTGRLIYVAPLTDVLQEGREDTVSRMVDVLRAVRKDFWQMT